MMNYTRTCNEPNWTLALPPPPEYTTLTFVYMVLTIFDLLRLRMRLRRRKAASGDRWRRLIEGLVTLKAQEAGAYEVLSRWEAEAIEEVYEEGSSTPRL